MQSSNPYERLLKTGAIGRLKRDILLEAKDDIFYLTHVLKWFEEDSGIAAGESLDCTLRLVGELIDRKLCTLAEWGPKDGPLTVSIALSTEDLRQYLDGSRRDAARVFALFLVTTAEGEQWVQRYDALVAELQASPWPVA